MQNFEEVFIIFQSKMANLSFKDLFKTTLKGVPNTKNLPLSISMSKSFYIYSSVLQSIILLTFLFYAVLSIFRVTKKIKNGKFKDVPDAYQLEKKEKQQNKVASQTQSYKQTRQCYEFDEQDEAQQVRDNKIANADRKKSGKREDFDSYHYSKEKQFIKLDKMFMFMHPFLAAFIICNNLFAVDLITLILAVCTIASFLLFNINGKLRHIKCLQWIFMAFSILGYFSFFFNDHDLTT